MVVLCLVLTRAVLTGASGRACAIGSALSFVPYDLHGPTMRHLVSGASLGAAAGAILVGPLSDHFSCKTLLVIDAGSYAAGAVLSAVTPDAAVLLIAWTMIGVAIGAASATATADISECPASRPRSPAAPG